MRKGRITIFFDGQIFYNQKYGGVSRYHAELFLNMKKRCKVKIPILFSRNTYLDSAKIKRSIRDCKLFFNRYTEILNENYFKLNVKLFKPDIIHLTWIDPYLWDINIPAKKVVTIHDMIHEIFWGDTAKEEIENKKKAIYRSDKIIAISENTKRDILYFYPDIPEEKISVIYHGIDKLLVERKPGNIEIPEKYVLFVGQRGDYKNGMLLLKAMKEMLRKDQMLHLVYIGGGAFKDYERKTIDEYNVELQVHQYNVTDEELAFFYSHAECFVYPSKYEGFGMPVLEAFDKNVPVICSDTSSLPEVAGGAALYFDGESEQQLRDCINLLLSDSNKRKEFIKRGREQKKKFSWEKCAEETMAFLLYTEGHWRVCTMQ